VVDRRAHGNRASAYLFGSRSALRRPRRPGKANVALALAQRPGLADEQIAAVQRLTGGGEGLAVLVGPAGTGKTFVLDAARAAWEAGGHKVVGTASPGALLPL